MNLVPCSPALAPWIPASCRPVKRGAFSFLAPEFPPGQRPPRSPRRMFAQRVRALFKRNSFSTPRHVAQAERSYRKSRNTSRCRPWAFLQRLEGRNHRGAEGKAVVEPTRPDKKRLGCWDFEITQVVLRRIADIPYACMHALTGGNDNPAKVPWPRPRVRVFSSSGLISHLELNKRRQRGLYATAVWRVRSSLFHIPSYYI